MTDPGPDRSLRRRACLLGAVALTVGSLVLPSASGAVRRGQLAPGAASGESSAPAPGGETSRPPVPRGEGRARTGARCQVTISVAAGRLTAGESATINGSVACPVPAEAAEQPLAVYQHTAGTPGSVLAGSATTGADGLYTFTTPAVARNSSFQARFGGVRSRHASVKVAPPVTITASAGGTQPSAAGRRGAAGTRRRTMTFAGKVDPAQAGALVVLQRESVTVSDNWFRIGLGEVGPDGSYSISHSFLPGTVTVRAVVRAKRLLPGVSEPLTYQIAQRQNPRLTLEGPAAPLSYGQSLTLSGTATGAAHEAVTLLARNRQGGFSPVASTITDALGAYSFAAGSPAQNTWYRVTRRRTASTTLLVRVKPLVTAQASASKLSSGDPLTFSGTIAPARAGQAVLLERQNPGGVGFHVVDSGTVGAAGGYSIAHLLSGAGTQVFRVKVARDAGQQAAASQLLTIQASTAGEAALQPAAPVAAAVPAQP
jgi:hypothetical protein